MILLKAKICILLVAIGLSQLFGLSDGAIPTAQPTFKPSASFKPSIKPTISPTVKVIFTHIRSVFFNAIGRDSNVFFFLAFK